MIIGKNDMKPDNLMENEYATKDLHFAAFMYVKGAYISKLEKYGRGRRGQTPVYFVFNDKSLCEKLEEVFWNGTTEDANVNVKNFCNAIRDLRSRAFSVTREVTKTEQYAGQVVT